MIVYLARDIPAFVMYCVYGESCSSLLIESTNSMMILFYITLCIHSVDGIDVRPADPNVVALRLNWLETDPNIHSGDPVRCTNTNCGVVLSCTSKLAQEKDQQVNYCLNAVHNHCCSVSGRFSFINVMKGQKQHKIYLVVIKKILHTFFQT